MICFVSNDIRTYICYSITYPGNFVKIAGFNQTAKQLFGVELRSEADAFIRLTEIGHRYEKGYKKEKLYKSSSIIFPYIS